MVSFNEVENSTNLRLSFVNRFHFSFVKTLNRKRAAIIVLCDALLIASVVLFLQSDLIVNGTLYYYGLIADSAWLVPYQCFFKVVLLLVVAVIFIIAMLELPTPAFESKPETP